MDLKQAVEYCTNILNEARSDVASSAASSRLFLKRSEVLGMKMLDCELKLGYPEGFRLSETFGTLREALDVYAKTVEELEKRLESYSNPQTRISSTLLSCMSDASREILKYAEDKRAAPSKDYATPVGQLFYMEHVFEQKLIRTKEAEEAMPKKVRKRYLSTLTRIEKGASKVEIPGFQSLYNKLETHRLELDKAIAGLVGSGEVTPSLRKELDRALDRLLSKE